MDKYNYIDGMVTMYEEIGSRSRAHDYAPGYEGNNRRHDYRRGRSPSPNRDRSPVRRSRDSSRSPQNDSPYYSRVYDDFAAKDYARNNRGYRDHGGYEKDYREDPDKKSSNRGRQRSRSRERDQSKSHSKDHRDRDHSRDNSKSRDRYSRENAERVDDFYIDRIRHRSRDGEHSSRRDDDYRPDLMPPSSTVIVQNLGMDATEKMIEDQLRRDGVVARNVAIIRERSGESKGYGFVEFDDINTAEKWLKITKRSIVINGRPVQLNYSKSKKYESGNIPDWHCSVCKALNFGSRKRTERKPACFQCGAPQTENERPHDERNQDIRGKDQKNDIAKLEPCNVLMLRGMDFSTTEEAIRIAIVKLTSKSVYDVRLIKDKITDMSRGFAFVELGSVEDATSLLENIEKADPPFDIDSRRITVGYARHGYNAPLSGKKTRSGLITNQTAADNAVAQASAAKATAEYSQSVADSYAAADTANQHHGTQGDQYYQPGQSTQPTSSYTYDPTSGYYYDASTGLFYDPNSGYYYNGTSGQFLFWNGSRYQAVNQDGTPITPTDTTDQSTGDAQPTQKKPEQEKDKVNIAGQKPKNARKIAKDMERWAKKMNNATEARKNAVKQAQDELKLLEQKEEELRKKIIQEKVPSGGINQDIGNKDGVRSMFVPDNDEEGSVLKLGSALSLSIPEKPISASLVTDVPDDDDDDIVDETKFVDVSKMACLLCKRQFPNKDVLTKHLQMSQLHKQNLENYKQSKSQ